MTAERRPRSIERARARASTLHHVRCGLGPGDAPYPEQHRAFCVAMVRRGSFGYRTGHARRPSELREGWLLLGSEGAEFECSHTTCSGDECLSLGIDRALVEEVRSAMRLGGGELLPAPALPPLPRVFGALLAAERACVAGAAVDADALALAVVEAVLEACGAERAAPRPPSARDHERVRAALDAIEADPASPWSLAELAARVEASPYHFARAFREIVGAPPHRYLVHARLRLAASLLLETRRPVTEIAYRAGFGDLSNFVHTFRREMGATPGAFRR